MTITQLVTTDPDLDAQEIKESISHLIYRMATLTDEDNPLDKEDRRAIARLWIVNRKLHRLVAAANCVLCFILLP